MMYDIAKTKSLIVIESVQTMTSTCSMLISITLSYRVQLSPIRVFCIFFEYFDIYNIPMHFSSTIHTINNHISSDIHVV